MAYAPITTATKLATLQHTGPSSAFKKWSGHVVQKGSRKGMFGYLPPPRKI